MLRAPLGRIVLLALTLLVAGCGIMQVPVAGASADLSITASALIVGTNGQVALHAILPAGQTARVTWSIASENNAVSLGQGQIEPSGLYTAPGSLSADNVPVRIEARLANNPS